MTASRVRLLARVSRVAVAVVGLALVLSRVDLEEAGRTLGAAAPALLALGFAFTTSLHLLTAKSWGILLKALEIHKPFRTVSATYYRGLAFAGLTPGGVGGDMLRTYLLSGESSAARVASSIILSRTLSFAVLLVAACAAVLVSRAAGTTLPAVLPAAVFSAMAVTSAGGIAGVLAGRIAGKYAAPVLPGSVRRLADEALAAVAIGRKQPSIVIRMASLYVAFHVGSSLAAYVIASAVHLPVPLLAFVPLIMSLRVLFVLPISISGLGVHEAGLVLLLDGLGVPPASALAYALLDRIALLITMGVGFALLVTARRGAEAQRA